LSTESSDLHHKLTEWLEKHGYPLEMEVASAFQNAEFNVSLSEPYTDFETKQQREIDVMAFKRSDEKKLANMQVSVSVECKLSKGHPWIAFVSQAQPESFPPFQLLSSSGARLFLIDLYKQNDLYKKLYMMSQFGGGYLAHGIVQAFKDDQSVAYQAAYASVKAATHRVVTFDKPDLISAMTKGRTYSCISLSAIVVDAPLFECFLNKENQIALVPVDITALYWKAIPPGFSSTIIRVCTRAGLPSLVENLSMVAQTAIELTHEYQSILQKCASEAYESILRHSGSLSIG
jgi:hypothetical protein